MLIPVIMLRPSVPRLPGSHSVRTYQISEIEHVFSHAIVTTTFVSSFALLPHALERSQFAFLAWRPNLPLLEKTQVGPFGAFGRSSSTDRLGGDVAPDAAHV